MMYKTAALLVLVPGIVLAGGLDDLFQNVSVTVSGKHAAVRFGGHQRHCSPPVVITSPPVIVASPYSSAKSVSVVELLEYGQRLSMTGRFDEAMDCFQRAVALCPDSVDAHYYVAVTYLELGDKEAAKKEYDVIRQIVDMAADKTERLLTIIQEH